MVRALLLMAAIGGVALLAAACLSTGVSKPEGGDEVSRGAELTRVGETGGVTVQATWLTPEDLDQIDTNMTAYPLRDFVLVEIQFTTHSGDLNSVDMEQAASLSQSGVDVPPDEWISLSDDSHHRTGVLVFPRRLENGPVELAIEVGDGNLELVWESPPTT